MVNQETVKTSAPASTGPIRPVLLTDGLALYQYGPMLRRLVIGLLDEVAEVNLVCLDSSPYIDYIPSPPVRLFTRSRRNGDLTPRAVARNNRHIKIPSPALDLLDRVSPGRLVRRLLEALAEYKPNLIHALGENSFTVARQLSKQLNVPYAMTTLALGKHHITFSSQRCQAILSCDRGTVATLKQQHPIMQAKIHYVPVGTHVTEEACCFEPVPQTPVMLCCAALEKGQGLETLLLAMRRVKDRGYNPLLILAGKGAHEHLLRQMINSLDLSQMVQIAPPPTEVIPVNDAYKVLFKESDIYLQPAVDRFWRPELLEAMSVGNIAAGVEGAYPDLLIHEKTGLTWPADNEDALANMLIRLLSDPPLARRLARNAQEHLRGYFLASKTIAHLTNIYKAALAMNKIAAS